MNCHWINELPLALASRFMMDLSLAKANTAFEFYLSSI